ncbi:HD-GYP domain-containing protein [Streptomyces sp. BI20]|uniref:HD-GYP domain-containing protein n=1 Tax=Streptomyces sp. BI20 TaxID=3403460 RepID=UPI003C728BEA
MSPDARAALARALRAGAALLTALALVHTLARGFADPGTALAFGLLVAVGECARRDAPPGDGRHTAPLGSAAALGYALLASRAGVPAHHGVLQTVAVVVLAALVAAVPHIARGRAPDLDHVTRRVLTVAFAAVCFRPLHQSGRHETWLGHGPRLVLVLLVLLALTALADAVLGVALAAAPGRPGADRPHTALLRDAVHALPGLGSAIGASGAVLALGVAAAGLWALPVFSVPLLLTQLSLRRIRAVRATQRQTIASLARATEIAGHARPGHARRVAGLSRAVGRELGLSERELTELEYAALLHDIGRLSLPEPVPGAPGADRPDERARRIAALGGDVARRTGVPARVAEIVARQADPYREQPVAARIVRTVSGYEELLGEDRHPAGSLAALERLRLARGHEHQPEVVETLARVLRREHAAPARPAPGRPL